MGRYDALVERLRQAVLTGRGDTDPSLRRAVERRAARLSIPAAASGEDEPAEVPPEILPYVDKVARHAYRVTDEDVAALRRAGWSEDALFELTLSAALGAGLSRLERGLAALRGERP